jgi:hypothetical protein
VQNPSTEGSENAATDSGIGLSISTTFVRQSSESAQARRRYSRDGSRTNAFLEGIMKFVCLGFMAESKWEAMSKSEQEALAKACLSYDERLLAAGHWIGEGAPLENSRSAKTLHQSTGKLLVTDGPFAETKEQLGGFGIFDAKDMDEAVALMSKHPGLRFGGFEIRPIDVEITTRGEQKAFSSAAAAGARKFVCLAYGDENNWTALTATERDVMIEECMTYAETRLKHAGWVGGVALQAASTAKTLRSKRGKVLVTDGPYAETKEQLGGVAVFRFRDIDDAVASWSEHPCLRMGDTLEIRAVDEAFEALFEASQRRAGPKSAAG